MKKEAAAESKQETEESGVGVLDASSDWILKPFIREDIRPPRLCICMLQVTAFKLASKVLGAWKRHFAGEPPRLELREQSRGLAYKH